MSSKANQFIKHLRSFGRFRVASELGKMGIHLRQRAPREQTLQVIDRLNPEIVEKHISRANQPEALLEVPKSKVETIQAGIIQLGLSSFYASLIKIHHNYLNQYTQKHAGDPQAVKQSGSNRQNCRDEVNSLLGVRQQIRLDPKRILHDYQQDAATLTSTLFPTLTEEDYPKRLVKLHSLWKEKVRTMSDSAVIREWLLIMYGIKKQREFQRESTDHIEEVLYPIKIVVKQPYIRHNSMKAFVYSFGSRQAYYQAVLANLNVADLANFVMNIKQELVTLKIAPMSFHNFNLAFSDAIIRKSAIFHSSPISANGKTVLQWVCESLKGFRSYVTASDIERSSQSQFFQTLASYNNIKLHLAHLSAETPENLLLELDQSEWYDILLVKIERLIDQVGVSELQGRNVTEKMESMKITVEFLAAEELDTTMELLEKLLFTIRSGIEWMTLETKNMEQNSVFGSELQHFFDMKLCSMIIKVIFMSGDASFDLHLVLAFIWNKFLIIKTLKQQTIQTIFFLINITTRYKCTPILMDQQEEAYHLLSRSIQSIASNDYRELLQVEVLDFLKEEASLLLEGTYRQKFLEEIETCLSTGRK